MAINEGDIVTVEYEGRLENGTVFDSSKHEGHSHPLEFEIGSGQVLPGFEEAIKTMKKGEKKEFEILPENAYGERRDELRKDVPRNSVPPTPNGKAPEKGMILTIQTPQGQNFPVKIIDVSEDAITLDLNHPLAGEKLLFNVELVEIKNKE
ncbi:MAG: peptidylprolyl isomerase [Nanoarchaeota archaeon]|nr:peptidylprolyl isomerase [Nanoarchaeota archaeon]